MMRRWMLMKLWVVLERKCIRGIAKKGVARRSRVKKKASALGENSWLLGPRGRAMGGTGCVCFRFDGCCFRSRRRHSLHPLRFRRRETLLRRLPLSPPPFFSSFFLRGKDSLRHPRYSCLFPLYRRRHERGILCTLLYSIQMSFFSFLPFFLPIEREPHAERGLTIAFYSIRNVYFSLLYFSLVTRPSEEEEHEDELQYPLFNKSCNCVTFLI